MQVKHKIAQEVPSTNVDLCGVRLKGTGILSNKLSCCKLSVLLTFSCCLSVLSGKLPEG